MEDKIVYRYKYNHASIYKKYTSYVLSDILDENYDDIIELYIWSRSNMINDIKNFKLPINLMVLNCSGNKLNYLPPLPVKLYDICCSKNYLRYLPKLSYNVCNLNIYNNKICTLLNLNILKNFNIKRFYCDKTFKYVKYGYYSKYIHLAIY